MAISNLFTFYFILMKEIVNLSNFILLLIIYQTFLFLISIQSFEVLFCCRHSYEYLHLFTNLKCVVLIQAISFYDLL